MLTIKFRSEQQLGFNLQPQGPLMLAARLFDDDYDDAAVVQTLGGVRPFGDVVGLLNALADSGNEDVTDILRSNADGESDIVVNDETFSWLSIAPALERMKSDYEEPTGFTGGVDDPEVLPMGTFGNPTRETREPGGFATAPAFGAPPGTPTAGMVPNTAALREDND